MLETCLARVLKENGGVAGAAFLVSEKYLLTCAHVVNCVFGRDGNSPNKPDDQFSVAFPCSTSPAIKVKVHDWHSANAQHDSLSDIAILEILDTVPAECRPGVLFRTNENLRDQNFYAHGFPKDSSAAERLTEGRVIAALATNKWLQVVATSESTGHSIQPGFSGAPAWGDEVQGIIGMIVSYDVDKEKREGFIIPTHLLVEAWPELKNLGKFNLYNDAVYSSKFIYPVELSHLMKILLSTTVKQSIVYYYFNMLAPDSSHEPTDYSSNSFLGALEVLAKKDPQSSERASLFEFLEYCQPEVEKHASAELLKKLFDWKSDVAKRLDIDLDEIHKRCSQGKVEQVKVSTPFLTIRIEQEQRPEISKDDKKFKLSIWKYSNNAYHSLMIEHSYYYRNTLEKTISKFLDEAVAQFDYTEQNLVIEFIIPLFLFDWNVNLLPAGPMNEPLGTLRPVVIRSWERNYAKSFSHVRKRVLDKWSSCPKKITEKNIYCLLDENKCPKQLLGELKDDFLFFIVMVNFASKEKSTNIHQLFTSALTAGISFSIWPLNTCADPQQANKILKEIVCSSDIEELPHKLKKIRENNEKEKTALKNPLLSNIMMLWDNPERVPPEDSFNPSNDL